MSCSNSMSGPLRSAYAVLALGALLSVFASVIIAGRKGELGSHHYEIIIGQENELTTHSLRFANSHSNPLYEKFYENYPAWPGAQFFYAIPLKMGMSFFHVVVFYTLLMHFLFGFGMCCITYGLFRNPKLAIAVTLLAYSFQPFRQVYTCNPWAACMAMAVVPLILAAFGLLMLNMRWLSLAALLLAAPIHIFWFLTALPVYVMLGFREFFQSKETKFGVLRKATPWLLFFYPIALAVVLHFKMMSKIDFSAEEWKTFWNLVMMRSNHTHFFRVEGYYLLVGFLSMMIACPLLMRLHAARSIPGLQVMTSSLLSLCAGFFVVQIAGNELAHSIAANAMTPLRIETFLLFLMLFHLMAGVVDSEPPPGAKLFAFCMLVLFLFNWRLAFSYIPICMPLWALLQARLTKPEGYSPGRNLLEMALFLALIFILTSRSMPASIMPVLIGVKTRILPFLPLLSVRSISTYIFMNFLLVCMVFAVVKGLSKLPVSRMRSMRWWNPGLQVTVASLLLFSLGAWFFFNPHNKRSAPIPMSDVPKEVSWLLSGRQPGSDAWRTAINWINANVKETDVIFVHPDLPLNLLTMRKISPDWGMTNLFYYVPSLFRHTNKDFVEMFLIDTKHCKIRLYDAMMKAFQTVRVRAYFGFVPNRHYEWIAEPVSYPVLQFKNNNVTHRIKPDFENSVVRIYRTFPRDKQKAKSHIDEKFDRL